MRRFSEADLPDLEGKTALVTGANTGLGFETARLLAENGARVLIACRNKEKGIAAAERINQRLVQSRAVFVPLDLANLSSVRDVVGHVQPRRGPKISSLSRAGRIRRETGQAVD